MIRADKLFDPEQRWLFLPPISDELAATEASRMAGLVPALTGLSFVVLAYLFSVYSTSIMAFCLVIAILLIGVGIAIRRDKRQLFPAAVAVYIISLIACLAMLVFTGSWMLPVITIILLSLVMVTGWRGHTWLNQNA